LNLERKPVVSVIGAGESSPEQDADAEKVGRLLAERGMILACGGRGGVMQVACRGAIQAGGLTVGILPGLDLRDANPYITVALPTGLSQARNVLVILAGQVVIAIGGGYGTLSEIAIALKMGKKVVGLNTWRAEDHRGAYADIYEADTPEEAVSVAASFVSSNGPGE
jgi:uncharacterized protein (TIGR00725 family)